MWQVSCTACVSFSAADSELQPVHPHGWDLDERFLRFHLAYTYFDLLFYFCAKLMYYTKLSLTYRFYTECRATAVFPIYPWLSPCSSPKLFSVYSWKILWPLGWDWNEGVLMDFQSRNVGFLPSWGFVRKPLEKMENLWSKQFGWRW